MMKVDNFFANDVPLFSHLTQQYNATRSHGALTGLLLEYYN